ncbi:alpha/beta fold hydrolase [Gottfriedia sp. NPDC056225]|uniref:alpha/beta fold hydrolase n=1 Tax=Gottfriedia sp. NPDC056225 TaxID=3345751 RepID=UPI0035D94DF4
MYEAVVDQSKMPYLRMGKGEPLVLLHGLSSCKESWFKQFELSSHYDLIIPDFRGHGDNQTFEGVTIENFAKDVICLLEQLKIENAHICGLSMGGIVAQEIYRQAPEKCKSLILTCTTYSAFKPYSSPLFKYVKTRSQYLPTSLRKKITARSCFYSWNKENMDAIDYFYRPKEGVPFAMDSIKNIEYRSLLPTIKVPTLIIGAQYDTLLPVWIQICMHEMIPNSELVILKNTGHAAKIESAKEYNESIKAFLSKHPPTNKAG